MSTFSVRFIGVVFVVLSLLVLYFSDPFASLVMLVLGVYLFTKKDSYIITNNSNSVKDKIRRLFKTLDLDYTETLNGFSTTKAQISLSDYKLFSILKCKFDRVYDKEGRYLTKILLKYQRYV